VEVLRRVAGGELHPEIHAVRTLEQTAESIHELAERRVVGKIVVTP
jgi:NADPH:quinone reductase-like Zn-dependent oxidoreductase